MRAPSLFQACSESPTKRPETFDNGSRASFRERTLWDAILRIQTNWHSNKIRPTIYPVLCSPAAMPFMVEARARSIFSSMSPLRFRRNSST